MAQTYDIQVDQGVDTERTFNCVDGYGNAMDFSGYSARMQVRRSTYQKEPIDELTIENGRLFFEGARLTAVLYGLTALFFSGVRNDKRRTHRKAERAWA